MSIIPIDSHKNPEVRPKQEGPPSRRALALPCPAEKSARRGGYPKTCIQPFPEQVPEGQNPGLPAQISCVHLQGPRGLLTQARPSGSGICHQRWVLGPRSRQGVLVAGCGRSTEKLAGAHRCRHGPEDHFIRIVSE